MNDGFISSEVKRKLDNGIPCDGLDGVMVADDGEDLAKAVYPFVVAKSKELKETYKDPKANEIIIAGIVEEVCINRTLMRIIEQKESVTEGVITARDLVKAAITSYTISKMLGEDMKNESDTPPRREASLPNKFEEAN